MEESKVKNAKKQRNGGGQGQHSDKELKALMLNKSEQAKLSLILAKVDKDERICDKNHRAAQRNVIIYSNKRLERRTIQSYMLKSQSTSALMEPRPRTVTFPTCYEGSNATDTEEEDTYDTAPVNGTLFTKRPQSMKASSTKYSSFMVNI